MKELNYLLSDEMLLKGRSPRNFVSHAEQTWNIYWDIYKSLKGQNLSNNSRDNALKFLNEVWPFCQILKQYFAERDELTCYWIKGNQNYDAKIVDENGETVLYEITRAQVPHETLNARICELNLRNFTLLHCPPAITGKGQKKRLIDHDFSKHDFSKVETLEQTRDRLIKNIIGAIDRKLKKPYSNNTDIIIYLYDEISYFDFFKVDLLKSEVVNLLVQQSFEFNRNIYVTSNYGNICFLIEGKE